MASYYGAGYVTESPPPLTPEEEQALLAASGSAGMGYNPQATAPAASPSMAGPPPEEAVSQAYSNPDYIATTYPASGAPVTDIQSISTGYTGQATNYDDTSMYSSTTQAAPTLPDPESAANPPAMGAAPYSPASGPASSLPADPNNTFTNNPLSTQPRPGEANADPAKPPKPEDQYIGGNNAVPDPYALLPIEASARNAVGLDDIQANPVLNKRQIQDNTLSTTDATGPLRRPEQQLPAQSPYSGYDTAPPPGGIFDGLGTAVAEHIVDPLVDLSHRSTDEVEADFLHGWGMGTQEERDQEQRERDEALALIKSGAAYDDGGIFGGNRSLGDALGDAGQYLTEQALPDAGQFLSDPANVLTLASAVTPIGRISKSLGGVRSAARLTAPLKPAPRPMTPPAETAAPTYPGPGRVPKDPLPARPGEVSPRVGAAATLPRVQRTTPQVVDPPVTDPTLTTRRAAPSSSTTLMTPRRKVQPTTPQQEATVITPASRTIEGTTPAVSNAIPGGGMSKADYVGKNPNNTGVPVTPVNTARAAKNRPPLGSNPTPAPVPLLPTAPRTGSGMSWKNHLAQMAGIGTVAAVGANAANEHFGVGQQEPDLSKAPSGSLEYPNPRTISSSQEPPEQPDAAGSMFADKLDTANDWFGTKSGKVYKQMADAGDVDREGRITGKLREEFSKETDEHPAFIDANGNWTEAAAEIIDEGMVGTPAYWHDLLSAKSEGGASREATAEDVAGTIPLEEAANSGGESNTGGNSGWVDYGSGGGSRRSGGYSSGGRSSGGYSRGSGGSSSGGANFGYDLSGGFDLDAARSVLGPDFMAGFMDDFAFKDMLSGMSGGSSRGMPTKGKRKKRKMKRGMSTSTRGASKSTKKPPIRKDLLKATESKKRGS
jgi:hypothetical protein